MSPPRVSIAGERGSYAEDAAIRLLGDAIVLVSRASFAEALAAVQAGAADHAVIPVENSIVGAVRAAADLVGASGLAVMDEVTIAIRHHLIVCPGATLDSLRSVESHPVALAQCGRFLAAHPTLRRIPGGDTGGCVRRVVNSGDPSRSAIGSLRAAHVHGGVVLCGRLEDSADNRTRFVLLAVGSAAPRISMKPHAQSADTP
ncbi:MAG: prephenate dehydratase [Gemmatimonadetes bacterium]|nr:prephenate dehydratase [Gemmatimonadota bacterium]